MCPLFADASLKLVIKSYAKVNLYLKVLNKRPDNYHNLDTLFERISLADKIILKNRRDNLIKIKCSNKQVPLDESNLCYKAAKLLQEKFKSQQGVDIEIIKRIPVGAGLGGGSSNAASVLTGLNKLWKLGLNKPELAGLAVRIGSDVAFFIYDTAFARAKGRGEKIQVLNKLKKVKLWHILITPEIHVSTPLIYKKWDDLCGQNCCVTGLTNPVSNVNILTSALVKKNLFNSLEQVTLKLYPEVRRIKNSLAAIGLKNVLMSGSGSAVFAIASSEKEALKFVKRVKALRKPWLTYVVSTK